MSEFSRVKEETKIEDYIGSILELKKNAANFKACCPFHSEETASFVVSPSKQIFRCMGCGESGDVFDFAKKYHKISDVDALNLVKKFNNDTYRPNQHTYIKPVKKQKKQKDKIVILNELDLLSKSILSNNIKIKVFSFFNYQASSTTYSTCYIHEKFQKLFEKKEFYINEDHKKRFDYILRAILSLDTFYQCPAIVIRDDKGRVCDIARYRPIEPEYFRNWSDPKYIYMAEDKKLDKRGKDFIYPFSREMKKIIDKNSFFFIGEGLKNGFIALVYGIPFISLESASNGMNDDLISYIKELAKTKKIYGAFDGDFGTMEKDGNTVYTKGKGAYEKAKEQLSIDFKNLFDFSTGIDFADSLKDEIDLTTFDPNKFFNLETTQN